MEVRLISREEISWFLPGARGRQDASGPLVDRTVEMAESQAACVDPVGRNNLILTESGGAPRLLLIDSGVCDLRVKVERQPHWLDELERRLAYLRRLRERSR